MPQPWFTTDPYEFDIPVHPRIEALSGPQGVACVRVWGDGTTDAGWGLRRDDQPENFGFMYKYTTRRFDPSKMMVSYNAGKHALAYVMRSTKVVCIDIDGKNGGLTHVGKLGMLPLTLAETSKSGDGYHLFYSVSEDEWDDELGFAQFSDRIGIEQGVDIRATGCVYHYPQQRWNNRYLVEMPQHLKDRLSNHAQKKNAEVMQIIKLLNDPDMQEELLMKTDELITDLAKPIPSGRRNNTLFAIGSKLMLAGVPDWEQRIYARATNVGLTAGEAKKLVANISKYGGTP